MLEIIQDYVFGFGHYERRLESECNSWLLVHRFKQMFLIFLFYLFCKLVSIQCINTQRVIFLQTRIQYLCAARQNQRTTHSQLKSEDSGYIPLPNLYTLGVKNYNCCALIVSFVLVFNIKIIHC